MVHASADKHLPARPMFLAGTIKRFKGRIAAGLAAARASRKKVEHAHAARRALAAFSEPEFQDTGIDPSDATGIPSWQPDLPFFMQSGSGLARFR
jgi:hypothetical protein